MKKQILAVLLVSMCSVTLLSGCTSRLTVAPERMLTSSDTLTVRELNRRISGRSVIIVLASDAHFVAQEIDFTQDSCSYVREGQLARETLALKRISEVELKDHDSGALTGMLLGGLGGATVGTAIGSPIAVGGGEKGRFRAAPVVRVSTLGAIVGGIIGQVTGNSFKYKLYFSDQ